jgi:hypothetical protein
MCYEVNPLAMKLHLRELDRQAQLGHREEPTVGIMPMKTRRVLLALFRRVRERIGSQPCDEGAPSEPSITVRPAS